MLSRGYFFVPTCLWALIPNWISLTWCLLCLFTILNHQWVHPAHQLGTDFFVALWLKGEKVGYEENVNWSSIFTCFPWTGQRKGGSSEVVECSVYTNYLFFFLLSLSKWMLLKCLNYDSVKKQIWDAVSDYPCRKFCQFISYPSFCIFFWKKGGS